MEKRFFYIIVCLFGALVSNMLISCGGNDEDLNGGAFDSKSILGSWVFETYDTCYTTMGTDGSGGEMILTPAADVWQFTSDNSWNYTYEVYEEFGTFSENMLGMGRTGMYQYTNTDDGGILTLYNPDGSISTYKKEIAVFQCSISKDVMYLISKNSRKSIQFKKKK